MSLLVKIGAMYSWFAYCFALAIPCALVLGLVALLSTRRRPAIRSEAIARSVALPFVCVAYAVLVMALRIGATGAGLTRAPVNGDEEVCPLPNGYVLTLSRDWTHGFVAHGLDDEPGSKFGHRYEISAIQVTGDWILGRSDLAQMKGNYYFLLSTRTGEMMEFATSEELRTEATRRGQALKMQSPEAYFRAAKGYRVAWWLYAVLLMPVGVATGWWMQRLWRMTRPER